MKRFQPAVAILRFAGVSAALLVAVPVVRAADRSLPETVTSAFETVVIDAKTAAEKATAAAKKALASEPGKSKTTRKAKQDADAQNAAKADAAATDKKSDDGKSAAKSETAKEPPAKPDPKAQSNEADKAADPAKPGAKDEPATAADGKDKKPAIANEWPAVEVELARARCTQLLKGVDAITIPEAPFRKGDCGTMAPVRLVSIGKNPEVSLSPPPVVTCDMVVALAKWMKQDVQPLARRHLGAEVIRMESMSDYSCRMAYGRIGNKLSEHGKANALDIRSFTTRKGEQAVVLTDWGQTKRDVEKQIAVAKAAAAKAEAVKVAAEKAEAERARNAAITATQAATQKTAGDKSGPETVGALPRKTLAEGLPKNHDDFAFPAFVQQKDGFGMAPTRLGGPKETSDDKAERAADGTKTKPDKKDKKSASKKDKQAPETVAALPPEGAADQPAVAPAPKTPTGRFLHEAHAAACGIFGTTLGPEANEAHRNHFHVDMAERKVRKICD